MSDASEHVAPRNGKPDRPVVCPGRKPSGPLEDVGRGTTFGASNAAGIIRATQIEDAATLPLEGHS